MEVENMHESPSSNIQDSEDTEILTKKKLEIAKRKVRNVEKENGEVSSGTNGDINSVEEEITQNGENGINGEENGVNDETQNNDEVIEYQEENAEIIEETKPVNGDGHELVESNEKDAEEETKEVNDSMNVDTEESFITAETASPSADGATSQTESKTSDDNVESENEIEKEVANAKAEKFAGFFGWLTSEKKQPETNGDAVDTSSLYFSSIVGRPSLRGNVDEELRWCAKTPNNVRNLDDSFVVKSEPSRKMRTDNNDRPNLRKFPAKRCLNSDEPDERDDSFLSNVAVNKRRKLNDGSGFLRSFLSNPFRKKSVTGTDEAVEESETKTARSSWFWRPFRFLRRSSNSDSN